MTECKFENKCKINLSLVSSWIGNAWRRFQLWTKDFVSFLTQYTQNTALFTIHIYISNSILSLFCCDDYRSKPLGIMLVVLGSFYRDILSSTQHTTNNKTICITQTRTMNKTKAHEIKTNRTLNQQIRLQGDGAPTEQTGNYASNK